MKILIPLGDDKQNQGWLKFKDIDLTKLKKLPKTLEKGWVTINGNHILIGEDEKGGGKGGKGEAPIKSEAQSKADAMPSPTIKDALNRWSDEEDPVPLQQVLKTEEGQNLVKANQAFLRSQHPSGTIELYRGISIDPDKDVQATNEIKAKARGFSSWTDDISVAEQFAGDKETSTSGHVEREQMPIDRILFSSNQGFGLGNGGEFEYIVKNK